MPDQQWDFSGLKAIFFNGTLTKSPEPSHTEKLIKISQAIMDKHGVQTELIRAIDHDIAVGVWPDMREHGYKTDDWPEIFKRVMRADILVLAGPIWLGDNSSETKKIIERLYARSSILNKQGQYAFMAKPAAA
jgi:multimeric flavodoxin WrbA